MQLLFLFFLLCFYAIVLAVIKLNMKDKRVSWKLFDKLSQQMKLHDFPYSLTWSHNQSMKKTRFLKWILNIRSLYRIDKRDILAWFY